MTTKPNRNMNGSIEKVKEFMELFDQPIGEITETEPLETRQLRIKLLFEELAELADASDCRRTLYDLFDHELKNIAIDRIMNGELVDGDNVDRTEELDALCDIQYVLNGKILTGGYHHIFDENFEIVHHNNMIKAHVSEDHILETVKEKELISYKVTQKGGDLFLLYNEAGKLIKPHNHRKVKLML